MNPTDTQIILIVPKWINIGLIILATAMVSGSVGFLFAMGMRNAMRDHERENRPKIL